MQEKRPKKKEGHAYDGEHYARQAARFWNVFKLWGQNKWIVEPDEDDPAIWVVWDDNENEIAVGNSPIQALESAIKRTRTKNENTRTAYGKRDDNHNQV